MKINFNPFKSLAVSVIFCSCALIPASGVSQRTVQTKKNSLKRVTPLNEVQAVADSEKLKWHLSITKTEKAWQLSQGNKNVVVAIIDSGVDIHHPDLKENIWINKAEKEGIRGKDDDKNGFIDDIHGWNFAQKNPNVMDNHGHGTHVAGIIGGQGKICKPGVSPQVSLMVLKYYNPNASGEDNLNNTIRSIHYAIQNGAHIINFSGGGSEPSEEEKKAIELALENNILFVTAGGNQKVNIEKSHYYPASYNLPNIFSVGASTQEDKHFEFSNQGSLTLSAHAPGRVYSTLPGKRCGFLKGTSQSTPIFTGGAVLVKTYKKLNSPREIIKYLSKSTDTKAHLREKSQTGGRANFYRALGSEDFNIAVNGVRVQYSDGSFGQVPDGAENAESSDKLDEWDKISFLKDISLSLRKKQKNSRPAGKKTPPLARKPASLEDLPDFLVQPSSWTKIFYSQARQNSQ